MVLRQSFRPIEACVILLPVFEFISANPTFRVILMESLASGPEEKGTANQVSPLPYTLMTLFSYLLPHASSTHSSRSIAYANLSLNILLVMSESNEIVHGLCHASQADIRLCRQVRNVCPRFSSVRNLRPSTDTEASAFTFVSSKNTHLFLIGLLCALVAPQSAQTTGSALLYVCFSVISVYLWMPIWPCRTCIRVCYRVLWYMQKEHIRLGESACRKPNMRLT